MCPLREYSSDCKDHPRIDRVGKNKSMCTHVGLLSYIRKIKRREHCVFFNSHEGVPKQKVAGCSGLSYLNLTPKALVFIIGQNLIHAAGTCTNNVVGLRIGYEIEKNRDGESLAVFKFETRK